MIARTMLGRSVAFFLSVALSQVTAPVALAATPHLVDPDQVASRLLGQAKTREAKVKLFQDALATPEAQKLNDAARAYLLLRTHLLKNVPLAALAYAEEACRLAPTHYDSRRLRAALWSGRKPQSEVDAEWAQLTKEFPREPSAWTGRGA